MGHIPPSAVLEMSSGRVELCLMISVLCWTSCANHSGVFAHHQLGVRCTLTTCWWLIRSRLSFYAILLENHPVAITNSALNSVGYTRSLVRCSRTSLPPPVRFAPLQGQNYSKKLPLIPHCHAGSCLPCLLSIEKAGGFLSDSTLHQQVRQILAVGWGSSRCPFLDHYFNLATSSGQSCSKPIQNTMCVLAYALSSFTVKALKHFKLAGPSFACSICYMC